MIVITNDDGIQSDDLFTLAHAIEDVGYEVGVVAPMTQMSGSGMAMTFTRPLEVKRSRTHGIVSYSVSGTPTDCVLLALSHLYPDKKIEGVMSGINQGINAGFGVMYNSGTISAAMVAAMHGYPAIAYSQEDPGSAGYGAERESILRGHIARISVEFLMHRDPGNADMLNVNFPVRLSGKTEIVLAPFSRRILYERIVEPVRGEKEYSMFRIRTKARKHVMTDGMDDLHALFVKESISITPIKLTGRSDIPSPS